MLYVIMCGGNYSYFEKPKALTVVRGETLLDRTIRLLQEQGIKPDDIKITGSDERLSGHGAQVLHHDNDFKVTDIGGGRVSIQGYWLNAFIKTDEPICYLFGDVFFTEEAIKKIVDNGYRGNTLFGTIIKDLKAWNEPLAYKVRKPKEFFEGIEAVKELHRQGKCNRHPIVWELYRYLNGIPINKHFMLIETYVHIENGGMDVDKLDEAEIIEKYFNK